MPDLEWNKTLWNDQYTWPESGDEWSKYWGGPRAQWYGAIFPRITRWLPAQRVLEIAPGFGRWTQFLLRQTTEFYGVDLSARCVQRCRQRFLAFDRAHFIQNDGVSLQLIEDGAIDFVFSFDSLVHVELDVLAPYCQQIIAKLSASGAAFIHHSNAANGVNADNPNAEGRAKSVSWQAVKEIIERAGGRVLMQEEINWAGVARTDCLTTFCKASAYPYVPYVRLENDKFMDEMVLISADIAHYY
jgi:SAM-dependent methyltransferase